MNSIYRDIATRTDGDIYIGVVGPVRTGKSTFIKNFMNLAVIPNISNSYKKERALDELPQSAGGRTVMTTEPKFIPNEAAEITLDSNTSFKIRMIDCVGYIVENANGYTEGDRPRMVSTPWSSSPMPFAEAAEKGTKKVITDHSTVGIVITTDGSVTELEREDYIDAEERVIAELKALNKPFIVVLNTLNPYSENSEAQKAELEKKYGCKTVAINCAELSQEDIDEILKQLLYEFPLKEININIPLWINRLENGHPLKEEFKSIICENLKKPMRLFDIKEFTEKVSEYENTEKCFVEEANPSTGTAFITLKTYDELFFRVLGESTGFEIKDEGQLLDLLKRLSDIKKKYDRLEPALAEVSQKGYGIISPSIDELTLEEPEIVRQGTRFGVKLKASAPSIHMIRADIETEVSPIVGTEKQSEELVHYLLKEFEVDPQKIWESNIFGKSLHELVNEGLHNKLYHMPDDAQLKLQETLQKIINEGSGGLICIIL